MAFVIADRHVARDSVIHRLDPRTKLLAVLAFIFCALLTPEARWENFGAMLVIIVIVTFASSLSLKLVFGRSLLALPFVLAAIPVLFDRPGSSIFEVPVFGWDATQGGIDAFASILARSWVSVLAATILTATTESDRLLRGLRSFGVPKMLVATISFMWRYVFVITEEAQRLLRAREARSARPAGKVGGSIAWRATVAGNMVGSLFLRSLSRSERVYVAMLARGYNGEIRSIESYSFRPRDYIFVAAAAAVVAALQLYARI